MPLQVPIDIAFWAKARLGGWFAALNLAADLLLMLDVALHFFRAYMSHNSVVITSLAQIRRHYLGVPFDHLMHKAIVAGHSLPWGAGVQPDVNNVPETLRGPHRPRLYQRCVTELQTALRT